MNRVVECVSDTKCYIRCTLLAATCFNTSEEATDSEEEQRVEGAVEECLAYLEKSELIVIVVESKQERPLAEQRDDRALRATPLGKFILQ